ncbi:MAG: hypothetical protein KJN72_12150 [Woeseia sp.]|nr:hypothetical protein [Woeseia sp.]
MAAGKFDASGFEREKFVERTRDVPVPQLAEWFKDGEPVFVVRGLTFDERIRCEAMASEARIQAAEALAELAFDQSDSKDKVKEIKEGLGWGGVTQPATRVSIEKVMAGLVTPKLSRGQVARIAERLPATFGELLEAVHKLTNQGQSVEKKSAPSGRTKASVQA